MLMEHLLFVPILALFTVVAAPIQVVNGQDYYTLSSLTIGGSPTYLSADSDDNVWVCQNTGTKVSILTNANTVITTFSGLCTGVEIIGDKAWVSRGGNGVEVYSSKSPYTSLSGVFSVGGAATRIKQNRNGEIWVLTSNAKLAQVVSPTDYQATASTTGVTCSTIQIDFDSNNYGWIACSATTGRLYKVTSGTMAVSGPYGTSYLNSAYGVGVDSSNNVWVSSLSGNKIVKFDNDGNYLAEFATASPRGMLFHKYRNSMFVTADNLLQEYSLTLPITKVGEYTVGGGARAVCMDSLQNLWVTSATAGAVTKLAVPTQSPTTASPTLPTSSPTQSPTLSPTKAPTQPTSSPTKAPTQPTSSPTKAPTQPTSSPTKAPTQPTSSPTKAPTQPTSSPTKAPIKNVPTQPTFNPTNSPTISHCNVLTLRECNADPECVWFPIKTGVSACRARALVLTTDCSQYLTTTECRAPGRPLTYCVWNPTTLKCINRFTPNPTTFTALPTTSPTSKPTSKPTTKPTTKNPTNKPTRKPTRSPSKNPTIKPTSKSPTPKSPPTNSPTDPNTSSPTKSPTSPCDRIAAQGTCAATTGCKWTLVKGTTSACRSVNWGGAVNCSTKKTLTACQELVDGVTFCVWDKPSRTCKQRFG